MSGKSNLQQNPSDDTVALAKQTMVGNLRDFLLEQYKHKEKSWKEMSEDEQKSLADSAAYACEVMVNKAVNLIAADGRKVILGEVDSVTVKDGYKAVIKTSSHDPLRHELCDAQGQTVLLVVSNANEYDTERSKVETDPDQPELDVEDSALDDEGPDPLDDGYEEKAA